MDLYIYRSRSRYFNEYLNTPTHPIILKFCDSRMGYVTCLEGMESSSDSGSEFPHVELRLLSVPNPLTTNFHSSSINAYVYILQKCLDVFLRLFLQQIRTEIL